MRELSTKKVFKKALKKGKNDIFYAYLGQICETYSKKIILIIDDINGNLTKICFYESYISAKITQNSSTKLISEIIIKLNRIHMYLSRHFSHISLKDNCYI